MRLLGDLRDAIDGLPDTASIRLIVMGEHLLPEWLTLLLPTIKVEGRQLVITAEVREINADDDEEQNDLDDEALDLPEMPAPARSMTGRQAIAAIVEGVRRFEETLPAFVDEMDRRGGVFRGTTQPVHDPSNTWAGIVYREGCRQLGREPVEAELHPR
jgi:hypothetical protein